MVSYNKHRNWSGTVGKIITSCSSPPSQHHSLHEKMKGNGFFSSQ